MLGTNLCGNQLIKQPICIPILKYFYSLVSLKFGLEPKMMCKCTVIDRLIGRYHIILKTKFKNFKYV